MSRLERVVPPTVMLQRSAELARNFAIDGEAVTIFDATCACHSCVLPLKWLLNNAAWKVSGKLLRLGHMLESGRSQSKYLDGLKGLAKKFKLKVCGAKPVGFDDWRRACSSTWGGQYLFTICMLSVLRI